MNNLERILNRYNRPIRILTLIEAPQCWRVKVLPLPRTLVSGKPGAMTRISHLRTLSEDIAAALGVHSVLVSQNGGIWLEIAKDHTDTVLARDFPVQQDGNLTLGLSVTGEPVCLNLADPTHAHVLVAGSTGSGKSVLLDSIIYSLARYPLELRMVLVDPHGTMTKWASAVGVEAVVTTPLDTLRHLDYFIATVNSRLNSPDWVTRFVLIVDEFANLLDTEYGSEIEKKLIWLLANARKTGINVIMATQHPGHETCKGMMKVNFPVRIAMMVDSWRTSQIILDRKGAESLNGKGDGLLKIGGEMVRFQGAWVSQEDVGSVIQKLPVPEKAPVPVKIVKKGSPKRGLWSRMFGGGK